MTAPIAREVPSAWRTRSRCASLCLFLGLLLGLPAPASAQTASFALQSTASFPASAWSNASAVADFDQDGKPDVAFAAGGANAKVYVRTSRSGYTAQPAITVSNSGGQPISIAAADVNRDGQPDLVVGSADSSFFTGVVSVYVNGGFAGDGSTGSFYQLTTFTTQGSPSAYGHFPSWVGSLDANADGRPDIVVLEGGSGGSPGGLKVYRSTSDNGDSFTLDSQTALNTQANVNTGAIADFDHDGYLDVAVPGNGFISFFYGSQSGLSGAITFFSNLSATPIALAAGDFDKDGYADLAFATAQGTVYVARYNPTTSGYTLMAGPIAMPSSPLYSIAVADFNRDGKLDIAVGQQTDGKIDVLQGTGSFTFAALAVTGSPITAESTNLFVMPVADFTGDGLVDIMLPGGSLLTNTTPAIFAAPRALTFYAGTLQAAPAGIPVSVASAPGGAIFSATTSQTWLTASPAVDLTGSLSTVMLSADHAGKPAGTYQSTVTFSAAGYVGSSTRVTLEVAAPSAAAALASQISAPHYIQELVKGDFNGDGRVDLVIALGNGSLYTLLNNGAGGFTSVTSPVGQFSYLGYYAGPVAAGDFNGDGRLDLAGFSVDSGSQRLLYLSLGDGAGGFSAVTSVYVSGMPRSPGFSTGNGDAYPSIAAGDLNGDGKADLAVRVGGTVRTVLGSTNGFVTTETSITAVYEGQFRGWFEGAPDGLAVGDFDGDGNNDVVAMPSQGFRAGQGIVFLRGDGRGGLGPGRSSGSAYAFAHAAGDFNGDGAMDVAISIGNGAYVYLGGSTFPGQPTQVSAAKLLRGLGAGDVNGDGKLDLVAATWDNGTVNGIDSYLLPIFLGNGSGSFTAAATTGIPNSYGIQPWLVQLADFTGDGRTDILGYNLLGGGAALIQTTTATPTATLTVTGTGSVTYGQNAPVSLAVSGAGTFGTPTGTAVLNQSGTTLAITTKPSGGPWTFATPTLGVGTRTVNAIYNGDGAFNPATSNSVNFTVTQATGAVALTTLLTPSTYGAPATFTATLSPATAGSITFKDGATVIGTAVMDASGAATMTTTALTVASHSITAVWAGDANVTAATSAVVTQVVGKSTATVTLGGLAQAFNGTPRPATSTTLPANLAVTFTYNGSSTAPTARGSYAVVATINDANYNGTASGTLVISKGIATVTLGGLSASFDGNPKAATAATAPANLNVTFTYNGNSAPPSAIGDYAVVATVNDADYDGTATGTLSIHASSVSVVTLNTLSPSPSTYGQSVTMTAAVAPGTSGPTPTGTVTFKDGATTLGTGAANGAGVATFSTAALTGGSHVITAVYGGDGAYAPATSGIVTQVVNKAAATVIVTGGVFTYDGNVRTASATTNPPGLVVTLTYGGNAAPPSNAGSYAVVATISDTNYAGSGNGTLVITPAPATATWNGLAFSYNGSPHPVGGVTVTPVVPVTVIYTRQPGGTPTPTAPTAAGSYLVTATSPNYAITPTATLVIAKAPATVALFGLKAIADGTPKGVFAITSPPGLSYSASYSDGFNTYNAPVTSPFVYTATVTITDPNYAGSASAPFDLHIKNTTAISLSGPATGQYNQSATFTATLRFSSTSALAPAPSGFVTFKDGSAVYGTAFLSAPVATQTGVAVQASILVSLGIGPHTLTVSYAGDGENIASNVASAAIVINKGVATVTGGPITAIYDTAPKPVTFTTSPPGLTVDVVYAASGGPAGATPPKNVGTYTAAAAVNDPRYQGSGSTTITITKATATITLGSLQHTFNGSPKLATATTSPAGLAVSFAYNGSATPPTAAGSYTVTATIGDANYTGTKTGTLVIGAGNAPVTITNTTQTYDGSPKPVTVTTSPAGLAKTVTYGGSPTAPTDAGVYAVAVTVTAPGFTGSATATLTINGLVTMIDAAIDAPCSVFPCAVSPGTHTIAATDTEVLNQRQVFRMWSDGNTSRTRVITVSGGPVTYRAIFESYHKVVGLASPPGAGTFLGDGFQRDGAAFNLTAVPSAGWVFKTFSFQIPGQSPVLTSSANPTSFSMPSNQSFFPVTANFVPTVPGLTADSGAKSYVNTGFQELVQLDLRVTNAGTRQADNAVVTGITATSLVVASGPNASCTATIPGGSSFTFGTNICPEQTYVPQIIALGAPGLGTIAPGGKITVPVQFVWPSAATRATITIYFAADGGFTGSSTFTVNR